MDRQPSGDDNNGSPSDHDRRSNGSQHAMQEESVIPTSDGHLTHSIETFLN
jgi:hypothetical protein